jgi:hypothetical protein
MATLKAKNSTGEWVEVVTQELIGELKMVTIAPTSLDGKSGTEALDLSPYIQPNNDFMVVFRTSVWSSGQAMPQVYIHSDGTARQFTNITANLTGFDSWEDIFPASTQLDDNNLHYDEDTRIFTISGGSVGNGFLSDALLIYAG